MTWIRILLVWIVVLLTGLTTAALTSGWPRFWAVAASAVIGAGVYTLARLLAARLMWTRLVPCVAGLVLLSVSVLHAAPRPDKPYRCAEAALEAGAVVCPGDDQGRVVTLGDLERYARGVGLRVGALSRRPHAQASRALVGYVLATVRAHVQINGANPPGDPAGHTPAKGKKKGRPFQSPTEP